MQYVLGGVLLVAIVAAVSIGALSDVGLAAMYARVWARLSRRDRKALDRD